MIIHEIGFPFHIQFAQACEDNFTIFPMKHNLSKARSRAIAFCSGLFCNLILKIPFIDVQSTFDA